MNYHHPTTQTCGTDNLAELQLMAAYLIPSLDWRANGLGLLQAYIHESDGRELRLHIWHPNLRHEGIHGNGNVHDHRFDMRSTVLHGVLEHEEYNLRLSPTGGWSTFPVVHARKSRREDGSFDSPVKPDGERWHADTRKYEIETGITWFLPRFSFHSAKAEELTVTLISKTEQSSMQARILAPWGKDPVHAFGNIPPRSIWDGYLEEAKLALLKAAEGSK